MTIAFVRQSASVMVMLFWFQPNPTSLPYETEHVGSSTDILVRNIAHLFPHRFWKSSLN